MTTALSRQLTIIVVAVLALLAVTVAVVLLAGRNGTTEYPADTPEGAFQRYLAAYEEGDYETAYGYFSERVREDVTLADFRSFSGAFGPMATSHRVMLDESSADSGDSDRTRLRLIVEYYFEGGGGLYGGSGSFQQPLEVNMVREDGEWRIDDPLAGVDPAPIGPGFGF